MELFRRRGFEQVSEWVRGYKDEAVTEYLLLARIVEGSGTLYSYRQQSRRSWGCRAAP